MFKGMAYLSVLSISPVSSPTSFTYFETMNAAEREALIELVERKIVEVKQSITDYKELTRPISPDDAIGRISRMDAINNKSVNEAALRKAEAKLVGLERILERKDDNDLVLPYRLTRNNIYTGNRDNFIIIKVYANGPVKMGGINIDDTATLSAFTFL